jgi:hypothetical protein
MSGPAFSAAELLVDPAIFYLIPTFEADSHLLLSLLIFHDPLPILFYKQQISTSLPPLTIDES